MAKGGVTKITLVVSGDGLGAKRALEEVQQSLDNDREQPIKETQRQR